jgi:putative ABC transport system permease protein
VSYWSRTALVCSLAIIGAAAVVTAMLTLVVLLPGNRAFADDATHSATTILSVADTGGGPRLTLGDASALGRQVDAVDALSRIVSGREQVVAGDRTALVAIKAVDPEYQQIQGQNLAQGTFFTAQDSTSARSVAVLGQNVATTLFAGRSVALDQPLRIRNVTFTVRGVLASSGNETDDAIMIPLQTGQVRLFGPTALSEVALEVNADQVESVRGEVNELLRGRHQLRAGQADDFAIGQTIQDTSPPTPASVLQGVLGVTRDLTCTAKGLCALSQRQR